jgi:putative phosphoesterase
MKMRFAIISDIHANYPALKAVYNYLKKMDISEIWNAGDSIGYNPFPNETLHFLAEKDVLSIQGNYDSKALSFPKKEIKWRYKKKPLVFFAFKWAYDHLLPENLEFLNNLPKTRQLSRGSWRIILSHGSPFSENEYITSSTTLNRLGQLSNFSTDCQIIISGHTHRSLLRRYQKTWFINPGSVGRADDGDRRASFAVIDLSRDKPEINFHRVPYPFQETISKMKEFDFPFEFTRMIETGRALDDLNKFSIK